jgi:chemotaxis protein histidine kinase CheA
MRQKSFFLCAFVLAWAPLAAPAQIEIIEYTGDGEFTTIEGGMVMPAPGEGDGESAPAGPPTPRLQELQKLEYDRRPSSMLAAWATPPKKPEAEKPPEAKPGEGQPPEAKPPEAKPPEVTPPAEKPAGEESGAPAPPANETEEQKTARLAAEKAAAEAAAKAKEEAAKKAAEAKAIQAEMESLRRNVTLGDWAAVKAYYATLTEAEAKAGYTRMLQSLQQGPQQRPQVPQQGQMYIEKNQFAPADVIGLAQAFPKKLEQASITTLGQFLRQSFDGGHQLETFLADVEPRLAEENFGIDKRLMARLLVAANEPRAIGRLVPTREEAEAANDREGLNLIARHVLAEYAKDSKVRWLEEAWKATQAVLAVGEVSEEVKKEALTRAVDIAPKIQKELGQAWLDESFTARPERGMEIVAAIGSASSLAIAAEAMNEEKREKLLELQTTAAKALLAAAPELAKTWARELELLAGNWLREAQLSYQYDDSTSMSPRMQRDYYGNFFYYNYGGNYRGNVPNPIGTAKVLEMRPTDAWLGHLGSTLAPRFQILFSQLYLKVGEEAQAFPYIESVCAGLPRQGKELADEFLRVWTKNHDPNSERNRTNQYMFFYGFEERANGIPLTRSKQERNLQELSEWVARLRKLPVELDDSLIASAFTTAHSSAEVFRMEEIEKIFGKADTLKPSTLANILQTMRANLVEVWRDPALQEKNKTGRRQKDIQAEVLRGYALGAATVDALLGGHPDSWELWVVKAALAHDENNFRAELAKDSEFSARRAAAFESFRKAASLYAAKLPELEREKESMSAFDMWFYAALGACDLKAIDAKSQLATAEIEALREALVSLPGAASERHLGMFAAALFTRMSNTAPAIKFRYVREGLSIVGDHKLAREARQVFDYYKDLVTEIQLRATIDGSDRVGKEAPFGLSLDIRHTREIERESGGFSKYLQNQNSQNFGYNYGRPLEDYRDKFEESLRTTLAEHFEVLSVTFNDPQVRSKAEPEYGWRVTPYAYALLKPRSEAVDRVPPIRLDLDFLDTTGYAVLPVESAAVVIDAKPENSEPRPFDKLALTQTLDERQAKSGKLVLEIKATATGLVPKLESTLDLAPPGFDITAVDDHGVAVVKFAEEGSGVNSERTWTVSMAAKQGLPEPPSSFSFGKPKSPTVSSEHFRFVDADLATVGETIPLEQEYAKPDRSWMWWLPAGFLAMAAGVFGWMRMQKPKTEATARYRVPETLNPFTVLGLLRDIQAHQGNGVPGALASEDHGALAGDIEHLERHFFGEPYSTPPDLKRIAENWVARAR